MSILKPKAIIGLILAMALFCISRVNNPQDQRTGAPGERTCADSGCHSGTNFLDGEVEIQGLPSIVETDSTYRIALIITNPNGSAQKAGFQLVLLDNNNDSIGLLSNPGLSSALTPVNNRVYWEHRPSKNFDADDQVRYEIDWTVPSDVGDSIARLYSSIVLSNGNQAISGDLTINIQDSVRIMESIPALEAEIVERNSITCFGAMDGNARVEASNGIPPYQYLWTGGQTTASATNLNAGFYQVTVNDQAGSSIILSTQIREPDSIHVEYTTIMASCDSNADGGATLSASGGESPYSYEWPDGENTNMRSDLLPSLYNVTITDFSGCSKIVELPISSPVFFINETMFEVSDALCFEGNEGSIDLRDGIANPGSYTYNWSTGEDEPVVHNLTAGTYIVEIIINSNCFRVYEFEVNQPSQIESQFDVTNVSLPNAEDGQITANPTGGSPPYSYRWSTGSTDKSISDLKTGFYSVVITDANDCRRTFDVEVDEPDCTIQIGEDVFSTSCNGVCDGIICPTVIGGIKPYSYSWNVGNTDSCLSMLCPGAYRLTVTDDIGCDVVVNFGMNEPTALDVQSQSIDNVCFDESDGEIRLDINGGTPPYTLDPMDLRNLENGNYVVTVFDNNGCDFSVLDTIESPDQMDISIDGIVEPDVDAFDGEILITPSGGVPPYIFFWVNQDGFSVGNAEDLAEVPQGCYILTMVDENGCAFKSNEICLGISSANESQLVKFSVHPNPFQDKIRISLEDNLQEIKSLRLVNGQGKTYDFTQDYSRFQNNLVIDIKDKLASGTYILVIETEIGKGKRKMIRL